LANSPGASRGGDDRFTGPSSPRLQLGAYLLLVEEEYGMRPLFGVVVIRDGERVRVENTEELRSEILEVAARIREHRQ
jgi:CRISPR-associated exonuclease Cas4